MINNHRLNPQPQIPVVNQPETPPQPQTQPVIPPAPPPPPPRPSTATHGLPPTLSDEELGQIQSQKVPPETLQQEASALPTPETLQAAISKLKHVEAPVTEGISHTTRTEYLQQSHADDKTLGQTQIPQHQVNAVHQHVDLHPLVANLVADSREEVNQFDNAYLKYIRTQSRQPQEFLASRLKDALKRQDQANANLIPKNKFKELQAVKEQTEIEVREMMASLSSATDFSVYLKTLNHAQRVELVTQVVGELKGYNAKDLQNLSQRKKDFIEAVVTGMEAGLPKQLAHGLDLQGHGVRIEDEGEMYQALKAAKNAIKAKVSQLAPDSPEVMALTLSSNKELAEGMEATLGAKKSFVFDTLIAGISDALPNQVLPKEINIAKSDGGQLSVPETVRINGITYSRPKHLADGGFGMALRYTDTNKPNQHIVIKIPKYEQGTDDEVQAKHLEAREEIIAHREIEGGGHPNIVGFKGAIRGPGDKLLIAMEFAPGGTIYDAAINLGNAQRKGLIGHETRQLLGLFQLRGIIQGTQHLQEVRQAHHSDFKSPNILIGADGQPKLTDFGLSGTGLNKNVFQQEVDNPKWLAPEVLTQPYGELSDRAVNHVRLQVEAKYHNQIQDILNRTVHDEAGVEVGSPELNQARIAKLTRENFIKDFREEFTAQKQEYLDTHQADKTQPPTDTEIKAAEDHAYQILQTRYSQRHAEHLLTLTQSRVSNVLYELNKHGDVYAELFTYLREIQNYNGQAAKDILAYKQANPITLNAAKGDTWGLGVVATELLLADSSYETTKEKESGKADHFFLDQLKFTESFLSAIGESIKQYASEDKRITRAPSELNIRELAVHYEGDPRFADKVYESMFRTLQGPRPPVAPAPDAPQDVQDAFRKDVIQFKVDHQLNEAGYTQFTQNYSQALQQFKAVLEFETQKGVTSLDKLLNGFLHPDPAKRITMTAALQNSVFQDERLDRPEVIQLMQELNKDTPDPVRIKALESQLR